MFIENPDNQEFEANDPDYVIFYIFYTLIHLNLLFKSIVFLEILSGKFR